MFCKNCGKEIDDNADFCKYCGSPVNISGNLITEIRRKQKRNINKALKIFWCTLGGIFLFILFIVILFVSICLFEAFDKEYAKESISYDCIADEDGIAPQGSAKLLEGDTILVSIYMNSNNFWDSEENKRSREYMGKAVKYIEDCGKEYGKDVNLIYNDGVNTDLEYSMKYDNALYDSENDNYKFDEILNSWIKKNIPIDKIKEKYKTDSIGYVIFLDSDGVSYTIAHFMEDKNKYFNEYSVIYVYEDVNDFEVPAVYAHEILHMFGAVDLYKESKYDGLDKSFVRYVERNYSNEIMYTTYERDNTSNYKEITQQMSDITAYMVGFTDDFYELKQYPDMAKNCRGCFSRFHK